MRVGIQGHCNGGIPKKLLHELGMNATLARNQVAAMAILPLDGRPRAPCDLAFMGRKADYWGLWKDRAPGTGLSQDDQRRYRDIGVTPATPSTSETSRAFF